MDPTIISLADVLDELAGFLSARSESAWAEWVSKDASRVRRGDGYGVTHFLSAFGGMGSLNDLRFHPLNGNAVSVAEGAKLQKQFEELKGRAWKAASGLRHAAQE